MELLLNLWLLPNITLLTAFLEKNMFYNKKSLSLKTYYAIKIQQKKVPLSVRLKKLLHTVKLNLEDKSLSSQIVLSWSKILNFIKSKPCVPSNSFVSTKK